jgi:hypothetical protein
VNNLFIKIIPFQLAGTIYGPYSYIKEIHSGMKNNKHVLGKAQEPHLPGTWDDDRPFGMKYKKGEHLEENGCILTFIVDLFRLDDRRNSELGREAKHRAEKPE